MADVMGYLGGFGASFMETFRLITPLLIVAVIFIIVALWVRSRKLYRFPVSILSTREGGGTKERETRGAIVSRRGSPPQFQFKIGLLKNHKLNKMPLLYGMTGMDRVYFRQIDPTTYIQLEREIKEENIIFKLVESDVKYGAILDAQRIDVITRKQEHPLVKYAPHIIIIVAMVLFLVMLNMMLEKFDPTLMERIAVQMRATAEALARAK